MRGWNGQQRMRRQTARLRQRADHEAADQTRRDLRESAHAPAQERADQDRQDRPDAILRRLRDKDTQADDTGRHQTGRQSADNRGESHEQGMSGIREAVVREKGFQKTGQSQRRTQHQGLAVGHLVAEQGRQERSARKQVGHQNQNGSIGDNGQNA